MAHLQFNFILILIVFRQTAASPSGAPGFASPPAPTPWLGRISHIVGWDAVWVVLRWWRHNRWRPLLVVLRIVSVRALHRETPLSEISPRSPRPGEFAPLLFSVRSVPSFGLANDLLKNFRLLFSENFLILKRLLF